MPQIKDQDISIRVEYNTVKLSWLPIDKNMQEVTLQYAGICLGSGVCLAALVLRLWKDKLRPKSLRQNQEMPKLKIFTMKICPIQNACKVLIHTKQIWVGLFGVIFSKLGQGIVFFPGIYKHA